MAKMNVVLPTDVMEQFRGIQRKSADMIKYMCRKGAEDVLNTMISKLPNQIPAWSPTLTRTYKTRSDGAYNVKVYFRGFAPFKDGRTKFLRRGRKSNAEVYEGNKGVPYEFLAIMFEYGRSGLPFPKHPFFRRSFNQQRITEVMLGAQSQFTGGVLDDK